MQTVVVHGSHPHHRLSTTRDAPRGTHCAVCRGLAQPAPAVEVYRCRETSCEFWLCFKCKDIDEQPLPAAMICVLSDFRFDTVRTRPREDATFVGPLSRDTAHIAVSSYTRPDSSTWLRFKCGGWILSEAVRALSNTEVPPLLFPTVCVEDDLQQLYQELAAPPPSPWKLVFCAAETRRSVQRKLTEGRPVDALLLERLALRVLHWCHAHSVVARSESKTGQHFFVCGAPQDGANARAICESLAILEQASAMRHGGQLILAAETVDAAVRVLPFLVSVMDAVSVRDSALSLNLEDDDTDTPVLPAIDDFLRPASLQIARLSKAIRICLRWVKHFPRPKERLCEILCVATKLLPAGSPFSDTDALLQSFFDAALAVCQRSACISEELRLFVAADVMEVAVRALSRTTKAFLAHLCVGVLRGILQEQPIMWKRHARSLKTPLSDNVYRHLSGADNDSDMTAAAFRALVLAAADPDWPALTLISTGDERCAVLCDACMKVAPATSRVLVQRRSTGLARCCSSMVCSSLSEASALTAEPSSFLSVDDGGKLEAMLTQFIDRPRLAEDHLDAFSELVIAVVSADRSGDKLVTRLLFRVMHCRLHELAVKAPAVAMLLIAVTSLHRDVLARTFDHFSSSPLVADLSPFLTGISLDAQPEALSQLASPNRGADTATEDKHLYTTPSADVVGTPQDSSASLRNVTTSADSAYFYRDANDIDHLSATTARVLDL